MDEPNELIDLVDSTDKVIGTIKRAEVLNLVASGKGYVRAIGIFLVNNNGHIWVPIRHPSKKISPGGYDFSASGHVGAGKTYIEAAIQEIAEELNLFIQPIELNYIGTIKPYANMPYFCRIYTYSYAGQPNFNKKDFTTGTWQTPSETIQAINNGQPTKGILIPALKLLIK